MEDIENLENTTKTFVKETKLDVVNLIKKNIKQASEELHNIVNNSMEDRIKTM